MSYFLSHMHNLFSYIEVPLWFISYTWSTATSVLVLDERKIRNVHLYYQDECWNFNFVPIWYNSSEARDVGFTSMKVNIHTLWVSKIEVSATYRQKESVGSCERQESFHTFILYLKYYEINSNWILARS